MDTLVRLGIFLVLATVAVSGQIPVALNYLYDDSGQLIKAIDSTGMVIEYVYDAVGNTLEIKRSTITPGSLAIFGFTPQRAGPLMTVTIQGQGFSLTHSANVVQFGGVGARVISASATTLVVEVPAGAASGAISVTVGGNTAASGAPFTALPVPGISSVSPTLVAAGSAVASFQVSGANLTGATFSFLPASASPAIAIGGVTINPAGTSAALSLNVSGGVTGEFVLVATGPSGSSSLYPTTANTLRVGRLISIVAPTFSALNALNPGAGVPGASRYVSSWAFSVLNGVSPAPATPSQRFVNSLMFSVSNLAAGAGSALWSSGLRNRTVAARTARPWLFSNSGVTPRDTDGDGVSDEDELLIGTNPFDPDTDRDGYPDGLEVVSGSDPHDISSIPDLKPPGYVVSPGLVIQNFAVQASESVPGQPGANRRLQ